MSHTYVSAGKVTRSSASKVARIAKEIVDLVERTNGPVFLHQIAKEVRGFRSRAPGGYIYSLLTNGKEIVYWASMTKAGLDALHCVVSNRRVAVQCISRLPYFFDGVEIDSADWQPIALLPVRAANLEMPRWSTRVSPKVRDRVLRLGNAQFRPLTPQPVRYTADRFSIY
jgi:hypothetical protein